MIIKKIPYGLTDFERIRKEPYYYVDKTHYIEWLEESANFFFLIRPRRFGKSLFINMLRWYYDIYRRDRFYCFICIRRSCQKRQSQNCRGNSSCPNPYFLHVMHECILSLSMLHVNVSNYYYTRTKLRCQCFANFQHISQK